jgi:hypothetical protein
MGIPAMLPTNVAALLTITAADNTMSIAERQAPTIHAPIRLMQLKLVAAVQVSCVAAHGYLVVLKVAMTRAARARFMCGIAGGAA